MTERWAINGRFRSQTRSGVQRVADALVRRLKVPHAVLEPPKPLSGAKGHLWEQTALPKIVRGSPLWSPCNTGPVLAKRQVVTIHDAATFDHPEWFSRGFAAFYKLVLPQLARRCLKIVTVSQFSRDRLAHWLSVDPKKIEVIWNGVDENFRAADRETVALAKTTIGLNDARYFACLSTIEPRKNLQLVLSAWNRARPGLPKAMKLLIIGKKGAAAIFRGAEAGAPRDDSVIYSGYVDEKMLPALLTGADALLYPSLYEGFGLPLLEAMACGTPALATRRASLPEIAADAAIYVDALDPEDLAKQLIRLAASTDYRGEYSNRGLARAKLFSWTDAASRMDDILQRLT